MAQQNAVEDLTDEGPDMVDELQPGTKLLRGQYTIVRYLNSGGFGITYLAKDSLDREVVIKECFPGSLCRRSKALVAARSRAHSAELRSVVQLFVKEARSLAKIVHPNIVAVHQVFEDNGTAYMAIDFVDGLDLQQIIEGEGRLLHPDEIVLLTEKLLAAVGFIHAHDMLHRDISPDNVLIDKTGEPILIDFGAAREEASSTSRAMSALRVVKDGYSPQEFYIAGSEQGPWSDLYALGATLYHLISGQAPVNGQARLAALAEGRPDPYVPLAGRFEGYPQGFLAAIDMAMNTLPKARLQSAQDWLSMFRSGIMLPLEDGADMGAAVHAMVVNSRVEPSAKPADSDVGAPSTLAEKPAPQPAKSGMGPLPIIGAVAVAALVGVGVMMMGGSDAPAPEAKPAETAAAVVLEPAKTEPAAEPAKVETAAATPAADTAAAEPVAPVEAAKVEEAAPEPEPVVTAATVTPEPEPVAVAAAPVEPEPTPAAEPAATEVASAPAITAPAGVPLENQIKFAAWDVQMPFIEDSRVIAGQRVAIVARILPSTNIAEAGPWLAAGLIIYSVNGNDVQLSRSVTTSVLNVMKVDPDGKARVVVEYAGSSLERQSGLLTVGANRIVNLANGVNVALRVDQGEWRAIVTGVTEPTTTDLRQGDILFRDRTTGVAIDGPDMLESVLASLVERGVTATEFSVIRDNKVITAGMQLAVQPNP